MRTLTVIIVLLTFFSLKSSAQKIWFSDSTNIWRGRGSSGSLPGEPLSYYYHNSIDTIYRGKHYTVHLGNNYFYYSYAFVRDDTALNKVFVVNPSHDTDSVDVLLYDYNLQVGDTFYSPQNKHYVDVLDSIYITGIKHKVWHLEAIPNYIGSYFAVSYYVIEGIGCLGEPLSPLFPMAFESGFSLICYSNKISIPIVVPPVNGFDNATSCHAYVSQLSAFESNSAVTPNPIESTSTVLMPRKMNGKITLTNNIGKIISTSSFLDKSTLPIGNIATPGMYYYHILNYNTGEIYTGKFVRE